MDPRDPEYKDYVLRRPWRAAVEDTIGGWCILLAEETRSPAEGAIFIADFVDEAAARHIALLHNEWVGRNYPEIHDEAIQNVCPVCSARPGVPCTATARKMVDRKPQRVTVYLKNTHSARSGT